MDGRREEETYFLPHLEGLAPTISRWNVTYPATSATVLFIACKVGLLACEGKQHNDSMNVPGRMVGSHMKAESLVGDGCCVSR
jgi:hypothetical protein